VLIQHATDTPWHLLFTSSAKKNSDKFCCISELKQRLVDVWQSAAERYWRDHQRVKKETDLVCIQMENISNTYQTEKVMEKWSEIYFVYSQQDVPL